MTIALHFDIGGIARLQGRIARLSHANRYSLLDALGAETESQIHRRLRHEKTAPDGTPWPQWSDNYAATRHAGHSLLMGEGHLDDSIERIVSADHVEIGSNLIYSRIHNNGGTSAMSPGPAAIPAREFVGFSLDNEADLHAIADDWADQLLERL